MTNLLVYLAWREAADSSGLKGEAARLYQKANRMLLLCNASRFQRDALLKPLRTALLDPELNSQQAMQTFESRLAQEKHEPILGWLDFFPFLFVYGGLYLGVYLHLLAPALEGTAVQKDMLISLGLLLQCLGVYLVLKVLLETIVLDVKGWKRWAVFGLSFPAYLLILYLSNHVEIGMMIPVWFWTMITAVAAALSWVWMRPLFVMDDKGPALF